MPLNDYLTLLLVNMSTALFVAAGYFYWGLASDRPQRFAPAFALTGLVALAGGLHMVLTWPIRMTTPAGINAFANVAFGEPTVLLGAILLAAALATGFRWPIHVVTAMGLIGGTVAIVIGARILDAHMTANPPVSAAGFILTGVVGVLAFPISFKPTPVLRLFLAILTLLASLLWGFTGAMAYWGHVQAAAQLK